ncbi:MAG TPA: 4'-phosphopantetheinyl transferase superfamily protein [Stenomitos sp.]
MIAAPLDLGSGELSALAPHLSEDERERARRFHFDAHRHRFIVARARLRQLLGQYLGIDPRQVDFVYGPHGKPALADHLNAAAIEFNVAHSGDLALYAFTLGSPVGVDIEQVREIPEALAIAEHYFSDDELAQMLEVPPSERLLSFFLAWTRKEAMLKAGGKGLSVPLREISVSVDPSAPALVHAATDAAGAGSWSLYHLDPARGYAAALAILSQ